MNVFNIKIGYGEKEVTLTILPTDQGFFKVIYFGGILGAIRLAPDQDWEKVPDDELEAGDLPFYRHDLNTDRLDVVLDEATVERIGAEITANH